MRFFDTSVYSKKSLFESYWSYLAYFKRQNNKIIFRSKNISEFILHKK